MSHLLSALRIARKGVLQKSSKRGEVNSGWKGTGKKEGDLPYWMPTICQALYYMLFLTSVWLLVLIPPIYSF